MIGQHVLGVGEVARDLSPLAASAAEVAGDAFGTVWAAANHQLDQLDRPTNTIKARSDGGGFSEREERSVSPRGAGIVSAVREAEGELAIESALAALMASAMPLVQSVSMRHFYGISEGDGVQDAPRGQGGSVTHRSNTASGSEVGLSASRPQGESNNSSGPQKTAVEFAQAKPSVRWEPASPVARQAPTVPDVGKIAMGQIAPGSGGSVPVLNVLSTLNTPVQTLVPGVQVVSPVSGRPVAPLPTIEMLSLPPLADARGMMRLIAAKVGPFSKDGGAITITLEPESLGTLLVEIVTHKQGVQAHMVTSHPLVKEALENNQAVLRDALAQYGLQVDQFSVQMGDPNRHAAHRRDRGLLTDNGQTPLIARPQAAQEVAGVSLPRGYISLYV